MAFHRSVLFSLSRVDSCHHPSDRIKEKNIWILKEHCVDSFSGVNECVLSAIVIQVRMKTAHLRRDTISWHGLWRQLVALTLHRHSFLMPGRCK